MSAATVRTLAGWTLLAVCLAPAVALAQSFEAGLTASAACADNCSESSAPLVGAYASVRVDDRYEVGGRYARMSLPGFDSITEPPLSHLPEPVVVHRNDVRRQFFLGYVAWHFAPDHNVHPFAGVSVGRFVETSVFTCSPPECEALPPNARGNARIGEQSDWHGDIGLMAGLSGRVGRFDLRGGVQLHNFGLELSTFEFLAGVGYMFGQ